MSKARNKVQVRPRLKAFMPLRIGIFLALISSACHETNQEESMNEKSMNAVSDQSVQNDYSRDSTPIGQFLVEIFEDQNGDLWFGTIANGVAKYDGQSLNYFTKEDGLSDNAIVDILEDDLGNLWFSTHNGLSTYNSVEFTRYMVGDDITENRISNILIDRTGRFWVGTWSGVYLFESGSFTKFPLPNPKNATPLNQDTNGWITEIMEDKSGNIWFGRDGYGACRWNPEANKGTDEAFTHFTKENGLPSNNVQSITEDQKGRLWFATRIAERDLPDPDQRFGEGGLSIYNGMTMLQFPELNGLHQNDIYSIYLAPDGDVWVGASGVGLYQFKANESSSTGPDQLFVLHSKTDRPDLTTGFGIQSLLKDRNGTMWVGFSGGLFQLNSDMMIHVSKQDLIDK